MRKRARTASKARCFRFRCRCGGDGGVARKLLVFLTSLLVASIHPPSSLVAGALTVPFSRRPSHVTLARRGLDGSRSDGGGRCPPSPPPPSSSSSSAGLAGNGAFRRSRRLRPLRFSADGRCGGGPSLTPWRGGNRGSDGTEDGCVTNTALFATRRRRRPPSPDDEGTDQRPPQVNVVSSKEDDDVEEEDQDWISDRELIRRAANAPGGEELTNRDRFTLKKFKPSGMVAEEDIAGEEDAILYADDEPRKQRQPAGAGLPSPDGDAGGKRESVYSDEEEDLIRAMGGKTRRGSASSSTGPTASSSPTPSYDDGPYFDDDDRGGESPSGNRGSAPREEGYLGDSTLDEISRDYSVPICYLADVLVTWGCPPPIQPGDMLGDLVTGEQAFSLLEALLTLDTGALNDRYSYDDLATVCDENEVEIRDAFEFCVREGYNLPFGVRTCLRVEQEEELLRALGADSAFEYENDYDDEGTYEEAA